MKASQHALGQQAYGHWFFTVFHILLHGVPTVCAEHLWLFSQFWEHMVGSPWVFRFGDPPSDARSKMMVCCCDDAVL